MCRICIYYPGGGKYYCDLSYSHLLHGYFKIYDYDVASSTTRSSKNVKKQCKFKHVKEAMVN